MAEQRIHPRVDVGLDVQFRPVPEFSNGRSMNISRGGIYICTPQPQPRDREILLRIPLPGIAQPIQVTGVVVWSNQGTSPSPFPPGMGIKFLNLTDADARLIADFVATVQKQTAPPPPEPAPAPPAAVSVTASSLGIQVLATPPATPPPPATQQVTPPAPAEPLPITVLPEEPTPSPVAPPPLAPESEIPAHIRRQLEYMQSLQAPPSVQTPGRPMPPAPGPASPSGQPGQSSEKTRPPRKPGEEKKA
jgi:uncharacterized protein (TIGR02266 family)